MRELLIGYLLEAIDADERDRVEEELRRNPALQHELELLHESLEPLRADDQDWHPPAGLARRTCEMVAVQVRPRKSRSHREDLSPAPAKPAPCVPPQGSRWTFADMAVAAGIFFAAALLLFPAMMRSRENARLAFCQNNLRMLGAALDQYSLRNGEYFPAVDPRGEMSNAGAYAVRLLQGGYLNNPRQVICPASDLAEQADKFAIPSHEQLQVADEATRAKLRRIMGGSYGYNLGYVSGGDYRSVRNRHRPTYAIMADAPNPELKSYASSNHGGCGQNVLYEDGHVGYLSQCRVGSQGDHIFLNDDGIMAAGNHVDDAVIGHSASPPLLRPLRLEK